MLCVSMTFVLLKTSSALWHFSLQLRLQEAAMAWATCFLLFNEIPCTIDFTCFMFGSLAGPQGRERLCVLWCTFHPSKLEITYVCLFIHGVGC